MGALGILFEKREQLEDATNYFLKAAYLFHQVSSPLEEIVLRYAGRTAQKLGEEKFNKILEETPHEIKLYLDQITKKIKMQKSNTKI